MDPSSPAVVVGLLVLAAALLIALARVRWLLVKILAGALALALAMVSGLAAVNDYYGYYRSWSDVAHDLSGDSPAQAVAGGHRRGRDAGLVRGSLVPLRFAGPRSGITRRGYVYLPPQYRDPRYRTLRFPVLELLHGYPGNPGSWLSALKVTDIVDRLISSRAMGPLVLVIPTAYQAGHGPQECLDSATAKDDTYLSLDVPADVRAAYRVADDPAQWGLLGLSSGGYCAVNLALRHRAEFGTAAALDGYFQPTDGPAAKVLRYDRRLEAANDPLVQAQRLQPGSGPVPGLWLSAGAANRDDLSQARLLVAALAHIEGVSLLLQNHGGHNFYTWLDALPPALTWSWQQLASPQQRVLFPLTDQSTSTATVVGTGAPRRPQLTGRTPAGRPAPASRSAPTSASAVRATRCDQGPKDTRATPSSASSRGSGVPGSAMTLTRRSPIPSTSCRTVSAPN
jgi:enterochelin esterase-like enzyme